MSTDTQQLNNNENNNGVVALDDPNSSGLTKLETSDSVKVETLGFPIEEAVQKISLLGPTGNTASEIGLAGEVEGEGEGGSELESSEDDGATSSSSSSLGSDESSSNSSDSGSDDDDEEDGKEEEEEEEVEEGQVQGDADVEVEHGEMEGSDDDEDESDDYGDKMVSWSMIDDDEAVGGGGGGGGGGYDDDDDDDAGGPIRSKNEIEDLPPVPPIDVSLEPHHQMQPVGAIMSTLGAKVIVEGGEKHNPLSEGSVLWMTESRKPLGFVDEIFGPVKNPYYVVRYNSEDEVPNEIHAGTLVSFVPEFANHVLNNKNIYKKGYDASGANDEELSDEYEFSDDEKEAEYRRMQKMSKRGHTNDQNSGQRKNNRKNFSPVVPRNPNAPATTVPNTPTAPMLGHGNHSTLTGIGQDPFGLNNAFPPFQIPQSNTGLHFTANGVWLNGTPLPQQQPGMFSNVFPTNGITWYPQNAQFPPQLPMQGIPFQQQLNSNQGAVFPGVQPNMFAPQMFPQGLVGQNQMMFGLNQPFPQVQSSMRAAPQQGFPSGELQPERNLNPGATPQFRPGASASNGRKNFHGGRGGGRKGWRPSK